MIFLAVHSAYKNLALANTDVKPLYNVTVTLFQSQLSLCSQHGVSKLG